MKLAKILNEAADVLAERGWCKGVYYSSDGKYCALGAIMSVCDKHGIGHNTEFEAKKVLCEQINPENKLITSTSISDWNDKTAKNVDEVIDMLHKAAHAAGSL